MISKKCCIINGAGVSNRFDGFIFMGVYKGSMKLLALIFIISVLAFSLTVNAQDKRQTKDDLLVRLKPAVFSQLPKSVISYLQKRGCSIPQIFGETKPHNVIRGQFAKPNQFDWAVLCSRNRVSSILVFWNGSTKSVAEIARVSDEVYLQTMNNGREVGFARLIGVVGKDYILEHYRAYGGRKPPPIEHQGINDIYVEKASTVRYFYRGRWLQLQGAD